MVLVGPDLEERDLVAVADVEAGAAQGRLHLARDDRAAVLGRADRVVEKGRDVVALVDVFAHTPSVPQATKGTGARSRTNQVTKQASGNDTRRDSTLYLLYQAVQTLPELRKKIL